MYNIYSTLHRKKDLLEYLQKINYYVAKKFAKPIEIFISPKRFVDKTKIQYIQQIFLAGRIIEKLFVFSCVKEKF